MAVAGMIKSGETVEVSTQCIISQWVCLDGIIAAEIPLHELTQRGIPKCEDGSCENFASELIITASTIITT